MNSIIQISRNLLRDEEEMPDVIAERARMDIVLISAECNSGREFREQLARHGYLITTPAGDEIGGLPAALLATPSTHPDQFLRKSAQ